MILKKMKHLNNRAFSIVEALILVVAIGVIVAGGWLVWNRNSKHSNSTISPVVKSTSDNNQPAAKKSANLKQYIDSDNGIRFSYPADWGESQQYARPHEFVVLVLESPDIQKKSDEPFSSSTTVTGGSRITLTFTAQSGKTLEQLFTGTLVAGTKEADVPKDSLTIGNVPAYQFVYGYDHQPTLNVLLQTSRYDIEGSLETPNASRTSPDYDAFIKVLQSVSVQ